MTDRHLWEYDHPYYCGEPAREYREKYASWADFTDTLWFGGDRDLNLLFRWDWQRWRDDPDIDPDLEPGEDTDELLLFFMQQRKGRFHDVTIKVTDEDEPAVRKFLAECAATMRAVWEPFLDQPQPVAMRFATGGELPDGWARLGFIT